ncbi:MAG: cytochrome c family protein, partial [Pseudomonadota bacterium]
MSGLELNKIVASVLVAGLIGMVTGNLADILYKPNINAKRGYTVSVSEDNNLSAAAGQPVEVKVDIIELMVKA